MITESIKEFCRRALEADFRQALRWADSFHDCEVPATESEIEHAKMAVRRMLNCALPMDDDELDRVLSAICEATEETHRVRRVH
jgi:hypothetical protein